MFGINVLFFSWGVCERTVGFLISMGTISGIEPWGRMAIGDTGVVGWELSA